MPVDRYLSTLSNYVHPQESNLLNLHKAMEYNEAGKPVVRTSIGTSTININGPVTIPGSIEISNDDGNPVPISGTVSLNSTTVYQGTEPWTITGTVEVSNFPTTATVYQGIEPWTITGTVEVSNFPTTATVYQGTTPWEVSGTVSFPSTVNDAFGRLRVSNPYTLFDSFHRYQDNGRISQYIVGENSTSSHVLSEGCIVATIDTTANSAVYRESSRTFAYQPGKSLLVLETFVFGPAKPGLRTRYGYFDINNGHFLERDGDDIYFVRRSTSITETPSETKVLKQDWNINKLDGTNGITLDLSVAQILFTQFEWLGVGSVVQGFVINGEFYSCHRWDWANQEGSTSTYMATACLPLRAEIENTATTTSSSTLKFICSTVISEGGYELRGRPRSIGHALGSPYVLAAKEIVYPVFTMRLKSSRLGGIVLPKKFTLGIDKQANYRYTVVVGGTTTGGTWTNAGSVDSSVEYKLNATNISGGTIAEVGYINASNQSSISPSLADFPFQYQLERNSFLGTGTEFTVCIETDVATGPSSWCSVNWEEIT